MIRLFHIHLVRFALILLLPGVSLPIYSQEAKSNRVEFLLYNLPDSMPPSIHILKPDLMEKMTYRTVVEEIRLIGEVKDESHIKFIAVNSEKKVVDESGVFSTLIELFPGMNEIRLVASDLYNNLQEEFIIIEYNPGEQ